jgi:tetratricopeptide repeat protein 19, mitochondrial
MKRLLEEKTPEDDIRLLHISSKVAHIAFLQGQMDKALLGYEYVLEKIQKRDFLNQENYHELYGIVKNLIGQAFVALKRFPEAKSAFLEALEIFKKYKDEVTEDGMILLNNLSCACAELKEYSSAQDYLKQAIEIAKKIDIEDVSPYHINLGMLFFKQKLYKKAQESCSQGWKISKQHENKEANEAANRCLDEVKKAM